LENLREKQQAIHQQEEFRLDQKMLDEVGERAVRRTIAS
jgi:flagellar biosynthesis chaperone FliJ